MSAVLIGPEVVEALREWRRDCPIWKSDLVFPTGTGTVDFLSNIIQRVLNPLLTRAGVVDRDGNPKYGMHSLRHFYASWCINRRMADLSYAQDRAGAPGARTLDRYGHLFPSHDDGAELAAAERRLLGLSRT
jgi:integrase